MNVLLSNDDGIHAEGLRALARGLADLGRLTVVAPDRNRSAASNSLTLEAPLRVVETQPGWYSVNGTPTDCVHLAISGLLDVEHELVCSGINDGANLGDDVNVVRSLLHRARLTLHVHDTQTAITLTDCT